MIVARRNISAIRRIEREAKDALDRMHLRSLDIREGSARVVAAGVRLVKLAQDHPQAWAVYMDRLKIATKGPGAVGSPIVVGRGAIKRRPATVELARNG